MATIEEKVAVLEDQVKGLLKEQDRNRDRLHEIEQSVKPLPIVIEAAIVKAFKAHDASKRGWLNIVAQYGSLVIALIALVIAYKAAMGKG